MAYRKNILSGRIIKIHGYQGAVTVRKEESFTGNIPEKEWVFLEFEGKPVPFFVKKKEESGKDLVRLWFEGYETAERVSTFTGCRIFIAAVERKARKNDADNIKELIGYRIFTGRKKLIGVVEEVIENPGQILLRATTADKGEILIPFHEDLITQFDPQEKILIMNLPDGLADINKS